MTDKWKKRLTLSGEFGYGALAGTLLAAVPAALFIWFSILPNLQGAFGQADQVIAAWEERATHCEKQWAEAQSAATVLYEWEPEQGIDVMGGLLNLGPGEALGGRDAYGRQVVRWYIPVKVTPVVYGDGHGVAYAWINIDEQKAQGPFVPEVHR